MPRNRNIKWDEKAGALPNARRELPRLLTAYFSRVRKILAEEASPRELHRLRLASKRLRYTLELFVNAIPLPSKSVSTRSRSCRTGWVR